MNKRDREILNILSEECAETIQIISKIHRFGLNSCHPNEPNVTNLDNFHMELGDMLAMIRLLIASGMLSTDKINNAAANKLDKLQKWSDIFSNELEDDCTIQWLKDNFKL